ncbi:Xaa-Pro dipeptidase [Wenzhouxiangella sp. AB-CW3]|uniref:Xaa-Pro dipeptidase n=1 Tax=Wenzhouxiangella sp. AB-CW3 TaxID=2771012 RepID=UPI00168AB942|nr:Xaa-Pro dipeptidase [Wenzhouxiangella sp. AB-CW3]QOC21870.1 Xaa-Pro dipeptidase [Wenzhouxiangella sp. AB-CW3]
MPNPDALLFARHIEQRSEEIDKILTELGYDGLLIHSGRPENRLLDDQHPPFRAHAPFAALVPEPFTPDCLLELRPGRKPRLWYCQPDDFWHLPPEGPASWWAHCFDIEIVTEPAGWHECFAAQRALAVIGDERALGGLLDGADLNAPELMWRLDEIRTRKTAWERECLARANKRAVAGHLAAARAFRDGGSELEIHLAYVAAVGQDQDQLPYNSICAVNEHAAVLHYQHRNPERPAQSLSFLLDAGADTLGYAADITRTWTGEEHLDFAALIEALDRAQLQLCDELRPGVSFVDLHRRAHLAIAGILEQAGLVRMAPDEQLESGVSSRFFPHGLGHHIGAQVHDVGGQIDAQGQPLPPPDEYPALRLTRRLEPGNVVTVEPGLYFIPSLLEPLRTSEYADRIDWAQVEALSPYGGIRIEDNVLVSEADPVNFTRQAFAVAD